MQDLKSVSSITSADTSDGCSPSPTGSQVFWSEESQIGDDVYTTFKNRKSESRKRKRATDTKKTPAKATGTTVRRSTRTTEPAVVGRRPRKRRKPQKTSKDPTQDTSEDEDEDKIEEALPGYLKQRIKRRKGESEENRKGLEQAGLRLPPTWHEIGFPEDEYEEELDVRPVFDKGFKPCAEYKDVELPYSGGIVPAPLARWLRDYQVQGASFLHELFVWQKGGILGDDMGTSWGSVRTQGRQKLIRILT